MTANFVIADVFFLPNSKTIALCKNIVLILSFALLTGFSARFTIETGIIPITMQTLVVLLSGILLGSKRGAMSQITYISMGMAGLPWFARGGGMQYIMSPTFGYILGFVFAAFLTGWLAEKGWDKSVKTAIFAIFLGNILIYIPGVLWLTRFVGSDNVLAVGVYPFIAGDLLKILLAGIVLPIIWKIINIKSSGG